MRTAAWETAPHKALRNCSKEAGGRSGYTWFYVIFGEGKIHAIKHIFFQEISTSLVKPLLVMSKSVTLKDFNAFLDRRRYKNWAHKISSSEYLTIWRLGLPVFLWAQSTSFLLSTLNSFRRCWRSAGAATHDLVLEEVDGKCQFVVDTPISAVAQGNSSGGEQAGNLQSHESIIFFPEGSY